MRGPVVHLGLADELERAKAQLDAQPDSAARVFDGVATRLEESGYLPHSTPIRELQARALEAAKLHDESARVRLALAWRHLKAGDTFSASTQVRELSKSPSVSQSLRRSVAALGAATAVRHEHGINLDDLATAVDELRDGDLHRVDAALALAEEAVAFRRLDIVERRSAVLKDLADGLSRSDADTFSAARIRLCLAECSGEWDELIEGARDTYPPAVTALILARSARGLALAPRPSPSIARWRDAVERACVVGTYDDAADWLYSIRLVQVQDGRIEGDINDLHRHALALRAAGNGSVLPESFSARERALAYITQSKWPDALETSKRYLWRAAIGADWSGELEAHEFIGDIFAGTGRGIEAVRHLVFSGNKKKLEAFAASLRDETTQLGTDLLTARPWERAAAFAFVAARADLIPDDDARDWAVAALREVLDTVPRGGFGPSPWLDAFKAFGQLADIVDENRAGAFLAFAADLVPREANTYRHSDEAQVLATARIARRHASLAEEATAQLLAALQTDPNIANNVLATASDVLQAHPGLVTARLKPAVAAGSASAALAVVTTTDDYSLVRDVAREYLDRAVAPRVHSPGAYTYGTWLPQTALLVRALDHDSRIRFARGMLATPTTRTKARRTDQTH
jgi:hypothetical protein